MLCTKCLDSYFFLQGRCLKRLWIKEQKKINQNKRWKKGKKLLKIDSIVNLFIQIGSNPYYLSWIHVYPHFFFSYFATNVSMTSTSLLWINPLWCSVDLLISYRTKLNLPWWFVGALISYQYHIGLCSFLKK